MLEKTEGQLTMDNKSRDTGNIGYTKHRPNTKKRTKAQHGKA